MYVISRTIHLERNTTNNMHLLSPRFLAACALLFTQSAFGQPALYSASSKAQGAPFDLVITEIKREPNKSYLAVSGYHTRTRPGSRWLMCAYTDLVFKRGFSHWALVYPPENSDVVVIGLSNTPNISVKELLGNDFDNERVPSKIIMQAEKFSSLCGMRR